MNLEKYKAQMSERYPNTAFIEETLANLKNNRSKSRIPVKKLGKAVGGAALLTAAAFSVLVGMAAVRTALSGVSVTERLPEEEAAILADREALFMTPLSNPDHAVRISGENGQVAMNENTTAEEMLACGAVIDSSSGFVGYEQICGFLRAYRNGERAELVIAQPPTSFFPERCGYQYIGLNEDGTVNGMYYLHEGERLSTFPFSRSVGQIRNGGIQFGYCAASSSTDTPEGSRSAVAGMAIDLTSHGRGGDITSARNFIPICTISDLLRVSSLDGETIRENYFNVLSNLGEKEGVNILWNGQYSTPAQLALFLCNAKSGEYSYCSTTITDLTKTEEYEECFYALEYLNGTYRIFTMKNGFEGEFGTELFGGYTVENDTLIFRNDSVEYRFPYVQGTPNMLFRTAGSEGARYLDTNSANCCGTSYSVNFGWSFPIDGTMQSSFGKFDGFMIYGGNHLPHSDNESTDARFRPLAADPNDFAKRTADPRELMKISEEYSQNGLYAAEINVGDDSEDGRYVALMIPEKKIGKIEIVGNTRLWDNYQEHYELREMPDGKKYLIFTEEYWRGLKIIVNVMDAAKQQIQIDITRYVK